MDTQHLMLYSNAYPGFGRGFFLTFHTIYAIIRGIWVKTLFKKNTEEVRTLKFLRKGAKHIQAFLSLVNKF